MFSIKIRASTAMTSLSSASRGLMSISLISVAKRRRVLRRTMISAYLRSLIPFTSTDVDFIPTLGATTIEGSDTKAVLFLAANNTLLTPSALPANIKGFRAYFQLKGDAASQARAFRMNFGDGETTGIMAIGTDRAASTDNATYTLDGRRISKTTQKGVYTILIACLSKNIRSP